MADLPYRCPHGLVIMLALIGWWHERNDNMTVVSVKALLAGEQAPGSEVEVRGWVRSRRDSKGGFSFLAVHDGSCQAAIQAVLPGELANYHSEVLHLSAGCSVIVRGELVASQGKGQAVEIQATALRVVGGRPGQLSHCQETPQLRIPAQRCPFAAPHQYCWCAGCARSNAVHPY